MCFLGPERKLLPLAKISCRKQNHPHQRDHHHLAPIEKWPRRTHTPPTPVKISTRTTKTHQASNFLSCFLAEKRNNIAPHGKCWTSWLIAPPGSCGSQNDANDRTKTSATMVFRSPLHHTACREHGRNGLIRWHKPFSITGLEDDSQTFNFTETMIGYTSAAAAAADSGW